jgi:flavin reductase (DIM6/NTAB) family NADH-FMN oxidoreductase RutF
MQNQHDPSDVQAAFRETMASVCTPVAVVTALRQGLPYGTTVSAFASLSMTPPMLLVSLDRSSGLLKVAVDAQRFGVNILGSDQSALATNFAIKGGTEKFIEIGWHTYADVPRLAGAGGFLACQLAQVVDGGDHVILLGDVLAAESAAQAPLTYHRRGFGTHTELAERR